MSCALKAEITKYIAFRATDYCDDLAIEAEITLVSLMEQQKGCTSHKEAHVRF